MNEELETPSETLDTEIQPSDAPPVVPESPEVSTQPEASENAAESDGGVTGE